MPHDMLPSDTACDSNLLKAPYRFVDTGEKVLPSPVEGLDLTRPVDGALSGELTANWIAETPLLVGGGDAEETEPDNGMPLKIDERYALPGSTIKGLIRSVMEIASFARLSFVEDTAAAVRDFNSRTWVKEVEPKTGGAPKGGWLFRVVENSKLTFKLVPATVVQSYFFGDEQPMLGIPRAAWHGMTLHQRLTAVAAKGCAGVCEADQFFRGEEGLARLVMSGETPTELYGATQAKTGEKNKEYVFFWPEEIDPGSRDIVTLDARTAERFLMSLNRDGNAHQGEPQANYSALTAQGRVDGFAPDGEVLERRPSFEDQLENPSRYGLPVFWRNSGGRGDSCSKTPILSLTAFYRVPYKKSIKDLVVATQRTGLPDDQYDLVQALLGWAPPETPTSRLANRTKIEKSLRSRVRFGFAFSENAELQPQAKTWTPTQPRASYWPFYLKPGKSSAEHPVDFNNPNAILSGRKRYPACAGTRQLPDDTDRPDMRSTTQFLKPKACFVSKIRFSNITPVELGALIWAITFGDPEDQQGYRHMLGRAKAYGYGQVKAEITESRIVSVEGGEVPDADTALTAFTDWVSKGLEVPFADTPTIRTLLATARPETGKQRQASLIYPRKNGQAGESEGQKVLNAYMEIRDKAQNDKEQAGNSVRKVGRIGLPDYE